MKIVKGKPDFMLHMMAYLLKFKIIFINASDVFRVLVQSEQSKIPVTVYTDDRYNGICFRPWASTQKTYRQNRICM